MKIVLITVLVRETIYGQIEFCLKENNQSDKRRKGGELEVTFIKLNHSIMRLTTWHLLSLKQHNTTHTYSDGNGRNVWNLSTESDCH